MRNFFTGKASKADANRWDRWNRQNEDAKRIAKEEIDSFVKMERNYREVRRCLFR